jgi:hypothetical protein
LESDHFLLFIFGPFGHHITEFHDGPGSLAFEISKGKSVEKALAKAVDDVVIADVSDGGAFFEETLCVFL